MKNKIIKIIKSILTIVQILILIPPMLLQYLSDKKMGVMRYLVFKKRMFPEEIFAPTILYAYKSMVILGTILCAVILVNVSMKKIKGTLIQRTLLRSLLNGVLLNLIAIFCVFSKEFEKLLTYHFFLIAIFVIIILQYIKIILKYLKE